MLGHVDIQYIHITYKTRAEKTDWGIKKILKEAFQIFHNSPARREASSQSLVQTDFP